MTELEMATIVARAIHTLERLRDTGIIQDDESVDALFVEQSWKDLRRLQDSLGVKPAAIDLGGYVNGDPGVYAHDERARMAAWNSGHPIPAPDPLPAYRAARGVLVTSEPGEVLVRRLRGEE